MLSVFRGPGLGRAAPGNRERAMMSARPVNITAGSAVSSACSSCIRSQIWLQFLAWLLFVFTEMFVRRLGGRREAE